MSNDNMRAEAQKVPQIAPTNELVKCLRQYMHNDGSGFVAAYEKAGVDRLVATLESKVTPRFETAQDLIEWLDSLCAVEAGAITNRKWEPAQRAIAAIAASREDQ